MNEFHVNTTTKGSQYNSRQIELQNGYIIIWQSADHNIIYGQQFNNNFEKVNNELIIADVGHPHNAELFKTTNGFGVIFKQNDTQIYTKFYDNECNIISDSTRINTITYGNMNSDAQRNIVEVTDGYIITWAGPDNNNNKWSIYGQKIDYKSNKVGEQLILNDYQENIHHSSPYTLKTNFGFIICWDISTYNSENIRTTTLFIKKFDNNCNQIDDQLIIIDNIPSYLTYIRVNKISDGYIFMCLYGTAEAFLLKVDNNFKLIDKLYNINSKGLSSINSLNNELVIGREDNGQAKMQRYDLNLNKIEDEILLSGDIKEEYYDGNVNISTIKGGYLVSWYSTKENDNTGIYAKAFIYEDIVDKNRPILFSIEPIIVDNNRRFTIFKNNIENLLEDSNTIYSISKDIKKFIQNGINLENSLIPLDNQYTEWINKIDENILFLKNIFYELKEHDNRITSSVKIIFNDDDYNKYDRKNKINYICTLYKQLFNNIKEDIEKLEFIKNIINNYTILGIKLGDANEKIEEQIKVLENAIKIACNKFDEIIIKSIKEKDIINK